MIDLPTCGVQAFGGVRVPFADIALLRKDTGAYGADHVQLFRQADDQTALALSAVGKAIDGAGWRGRSFANWGVAASGRSIGRVRFAAALDRLQRLAARGVSPLLVPHLSLHSMAGTLSILLQMHGPHYGVSGRSNQLSETLLAGLCAIQDEDVDGIWIAITELQPEPRIDADGKIVNEVFGLAAALALSRNEGAFELTLGPGVDVSATVGDLIAWLQAPSATDWRCGVAGVGALELRRSMPQITRKAG